MKKIIIVFILFALQSIQIAAQNIDTTLVDTQTDNRDSVVSNDNKVSLFTSEGSEDVKDSAMVSELKNIYSNLEYNTSSFNDLKKKWFVNDPVFVRETFNRFVVKNALRLNGKKINREIVESKLKDIYEGKIIIDLRKRYYDDEIEYFAFLPESEIDKPQPRYLFDPVTDGFYLKEVLGNKLYSKIQEQSYFFSNITKDEHDTKSGYYYDLKLNLLEPEIMFWSTTSNFRNKYLVSAFGKWGNDNIMLPGWSYNEYFGGLSLAYHRILSDNPEDYFYNIKIGTGIPVKTPFKSSIPDTILYKTGYNLYFSLSGRPIELLLPGFKYLYFDLEGITTVNDLSGSDLGSSDKRREFFSIRNSFSIKLTKKKILNLHDFGMLKAGIGYSTHSIDRFSLMPFGGGLMNLKAELSSPSYLIANIGVERTGGLLQHDIQAFAGYEKNAKYGYWGISTKLMLNDTFGFDVRYLKAFGLDPQVHSWRKNSYLVFSPVFRINY